MKDQMKDFTVIFAHGRIASDRILGFVSAFAPCSVWFLTTLMQHVFVVSCFHSWCYSHLKHLEHFPKDATLQVRELAKDSDCSLLKCMGHWVISAFVIQRQCYYHKQKRRSPVNSSFINKAHQQLYLFRGASGLHP